MVYIYDLCIFLIAQKIQKDIEKEIEKYQVFNTKWNLMLKKFPNPITDEEKQKQYNFYIVKSIVVIMIKVVILQNKHKKNMK